MGAAIRKIKQGKSAGPTGVVAEMLKLQAKLPTGTLWMTDACNAVVKDGYGKVLPEDWSRHRRRSL